MNRDADDVAASTIQFAEAFAYPKTEARAKKAEQLVRKKQSSSCEKAEQFVRKKSRHGDQACYFRAASTTSPLSATGSKPA
jgi:hypothetical protein